MSKINQGNATPLEDIDGTASACQKALGATCKALKAFSFYPEKHPLRQEILLSAYQAMADLSSQGAVSLIVQRNGFSFADQGSALDNTPMTTALAQELFAHELQRLTFLPELSLSDFTGFLALLATAPQKISETGGVAGMLKQSGISTIVVNEIDITAVFTRRELGQAAEKAPADGAEVREERDRTAQSGDGRSEPPDQMTVEELTAAMSVATDDDRYRDLARMLLAKGQPLKLAGDFDRLQALLVAIAEQNADETRSAARRECGLMVLRNFGLGEMTEHLLDHLDDEAEIVCRILGQLGAGVVDAVIGRLLAADSNSSRKSLTAALVRIGSPAQPSLTRLLQDGRWQVVLSAVAVLGAMGNRSAANALALAAYHSDSRVRMQAIRSLAGIGGMEATAVLIELLRDDNQAVAMHAIKWLGNTRNAKALDPLLRLVMKLDLLGKYQPLKKEALAAIGRIGDRRALEPLFRVVNKRYWIVPSRWDELRLLAVAAIGNVGGDSARAFLENLSTASAGLDTASNAALKAMAQRNSEPV